MNEHDSERLAGALVADGLVATADLDTADVVVFNTCCIRENADNKFYGHLGNLKTMRESRPDMQIAVSGCLAQMDGERVRQRAPHVDVVVGTHNLTRAPALLRQAAQSGPVVEILDGPVVGADGRSTAPAGCRPGRGARCSLRGMGHHPDRLRQLVCLLHRSGGAGARGVPSGRRPGGRGAGPGPPRGDRGDPARTERELLRTGHHPSPTPVRRAAPGSGRGRGHPAGAVHQPSPQGPAAGDHRRHGRDRGRLQPPPSPPAVGQ